MGWFGEKIRLVGCRREKRLLQVLNVITWNRVHQKTNINPGIRLHQNEQKTQGIDFTKKRTSTQGFDCTKNEQKTQGIDFTKKTNNFYIHDGLALRTCAALLFDNVLKLTKSGIMRVLAELLFGDELVEGDGGYVMIFGEPCVAPKAQSGPVGAGRPLWRTPVAGFVIVDIHMPQVGVEGHLAVGVGLVELDLDAVGLGCLVRVEIFFVLLCTTYSLSAEEDRRIKLVIVGCVGVGCDGW